MKHSENFIQVLSTAIDAVKGNIENYSARETSDSLRKAFIDLNGGSNKINLKNFYRGNELFELVEELIPAIIDEGFRANDVAMSLVDYRNFADGDSQEFYLEGNAPFSVAKVAPGISGVRRQRLLGGEIVKVETAPRYVKVYDELGRFLAGQVDFGTLVDKVADAFSKQVMSDAYAALEGITAATAGFNSDSVKTGSYSEATLLALVEYVEAKTGKPAKILGCRSALRKVTTAITGDETKSDMYNLGHYGKFNGTEMICLRQAYKPGTDTAAISDSKLYVVAGDEKVIKVVNEGSGYIGERGPEYNDDMTKEYVYIQSYGVAAVAGEVMGVYTLS